jgi:hypothetical protein
MRGQVSTFDAAPMPEMIVYLESLDPSLRFDPPPDAQISQKGARFSPPLLIISVGQSVVFSNDEDRVLEHNVFSRSAAKSFDLGLYKPPEARRVTFDKPGAVRLFCSIHRYMDGMIYICPSPYWAKVGADGCYQIAQVPPGQWRVRTWQRTARYAEQNLVVTVGADSVTLDLRLTR